MLEDYFRFRNSSAVIGLFAFARRLGEFGTRQFGGGGKSRQHPRSCVGVESGPIIFISIACFVRLRRLQSLISAHQYNNGQERQEAQSCPVCAGL